MDSNTYAIRDENGKTLGTVVVGRPNGIGSSDLRTLNEKSRQFERRTQRWDGLQVTVSGENFSIPLNKGLVGYKDKAPIPYSGVISEKEPVTVSVNGVGDQYNEFVRQVCEYLSSSAQAPVGVGHLTRIAERRLF